MILGPHDIRIPSGFEIWAGADTGTYMGGCIAAISPTLHCYVLEEFCNYTYVGDGTIELTGETVSEWIRRFANRLRYWTKERKFSAWVDANTTFKTEVGHGLRFRMNRKDLELRTEITKEYVRNGRLHLAPWLVNIPYELQEAKYPEKESSGTGKLRRVKIKDHALDGVEHICSRRPHPDFSDGKKAEKSGLEQMRARAGKPVFAPSGDIHLGLQ
jgi:hypothetical protein